MLSYLQNVIVILGEILEELWSHWEREAVALSRRGAISNGRSRWRWNIILNSFIKLCF